MSWSSQLMLSNGIKETRQGGGGGGGDNWPLLTSSSQLMPSTEQRQPDRGGWVGVGGGWGGGVWRQLTLDIWMRKRSTKTEKPGRSSLVAMPQYTEFSKSCSCLSRKHTKWVSSDHDGLSTPQYLGGKRTLSLKQCWPVFLHMWYVHKGREGERERGREREREGGRERERSPKSVLLLIREGMREGKREMKRDGWKEREKWRETYWRKERNEET